MPIPTILPAPEGCNTPELSALWDAYNVTRKALAKVRPGQPAFRATYADSLKAYRAYWAAHDKGNLPATESSPFPGQA